jgi:hypothetical protein
MRSSSNVNNMTDKEEYLAKYREYMAQQEDRFARLLSLKRLFIREMEGDGNCLFRAISD